MYDLGNLAYDFDTYPDYTYDLVFDKPKRGKSKTSKYIIYALIALVIILVIAIIAVYYFFSKPKDCLPSNLCFELGNPSIAPWNASNFPDQNAKWIWNIPNADNNAPVNIPITFSKIYNASDNINAVITVYSDSKADIYINRVKIGTTIPGVRYCLITKDLPLIAGNNIIEIKTFNKLPPDVPKAGGLYYAGIIASISVASKVLTHTDSTWTWSYTV